MLRKKPGFMNRTPWIADLTGGRARPKR